MKELICIVCPRGCHLKAEGPDEHGNYSVTGNSCPRGAEYAVAELTHPTRMVTSSVRCTGGSHPRCPVKTSDAIPKHLIFDAMKEIEAASVTAPVKIGDVVIPHICGTDIDLVACKNIA